MKMVPVMVRLSAAQKRDLDELKAQGYNIAGLVRVAVGQKLAEIKARGR